MRGLVKGKVAFVTGGAQGLGRAIGAMLAKEGAKGLVFDQASALKLHPPIPGFGRVAGDVTDEASLAEAMKDLVLKFGQIDIVVANAGIVPEDNTTAELDFDEWERVMSVNARGVAATIKHAVPAMRTGGGSIIAMASVNLTVPRARQMAYTASKHAVLGIVRVAAHDLGQYGIRVNALAPGPVATEALLERVRRRARNGVSNRMALQAMADRTALRRIATEKDVAKAALFLASDLASGITGAVLPIDAGRLSTEGVRLRRQPQSEWQPREPAEAC